VRRDRSRFGRLGYGRRRLRRQSQPDLLVTGRGRGRLTSKAERVATEPCGIMLVTSASKTARQQMAFRLDFALPDRQRGTDAKLSTTAAVWDFAIIGG
jgi:hypothetical protein